MKCYLFFRRKIAKNSNRSFCCSTVQQKNNKSTYDTETNWETPNNSKYHRSTVINFLSKSYIYTHTQSPRRMKSHNKKVNYDQFFRRKIAKNSNRSFCCSTVQQKNTENDTEKNIEKRPIVSKYHRSTFCLNHTFYTHTQSLRGMKSHNKKVNSMHQCLILCFVHIFYFFTKKC